MEWLNGIIKTDQQLFIFLNSFYNDFWDTMMFFITRKETWLPFYLILLFYIFKTYKSKGFLIIFFLLLAMVASDQLSVVIKDSVQRLRPVYEPRIQHLVHNYFRMGGLYGFFSSHASNAFVLVAFTSVIFKNRLYKYSVFIWALIVSYSRIYLGVHYPLDIFAGIAFGFLLGWSFYKFMMFFENHFFIGRQPKIRKTNLEKSAAISVMLAILIIICVLLIVTRNLHHYQIL